jgi:23S rRNA pseudouridine1911/1915/1917 synthase
MTVIFEDTNILVLDKKAGITVNNSDTTVNQETVQDWVEQKLKVEGLKFKAEEENDFYKRAGIVHRLDKETSGILLVAKDEESFRNLQKQFKERTVKKTYIALAHGKMALGEGEIRVPVGRLPWNRKRFGVLAGGKEAATKYEVIRSGELLAKRGVLEPVALLQVSPETGRTHQIRVHLKYINHPIFGDSIYAGRKTAREDRKILPRVFLHAAKISFMHPKTGERISFEAQLPQELENLIRGEA